MSPAVYRVFEELCAAVEPRGDVLEVGAVSGPDGLLGLPGLRHAARRVGINLDPAAGGAGDGVEIVTGNANAMTMFADARFDLVLCNATLEHDARFWLTVAEMQRVTKRGGLIIIGVPGYAGMGPTTFAHRRSPVGLILRGLARFPRADVLRAGAVTLGVHNFPGDYYRFSEQAVREVFLGGLTDVTVRRVMNPPRLIGCGRKP